MRTRVRLSRAPPGARWHRCASAEPVVTWRESSFSFAPRGDRASMPQASASCHKAAVHDHAAHAGHGNADQVICPAPRRPRAGRCDEVPSGKQMYTRSAAFSLIFFFLLLSMFAFCQWIKVINILHRCNPYYERRWRHLDHVIATQRRCLQKKNQTEHRS